FLVPSGVAPRLISAPRSLRFLLERLPLPLLPFLAPAILRRPAESAGTASPSLERKFRRPADCYRTTAPPDLGARPIPPHSARRSPLRGTLQIELGPRHSPRLQDTPEPFLPPTSARWCPQSAIQRVPPAGPLSPHIPQSFAALRCVARLQHPGLESFAPVPAARAERHPVSPPSCEPLPRARNPALRWPSRAPLQILHEANLHLSPETIPVG